MKLKKWLSFSLYKKLWSLIGGRPWTFVRRDWFHEFEIINIVFFVSIGFVSGIFFWDIYYWFVAHPYFLILLVAGFYFVGVLQGYFYWGKKWVKGQKR